MRLVDADKLYPDCLSKNGRLAISQNQLANAQTIEPTYVSDLPDDKVKDLQKLAIDYGEGIAVFERKRPQGEWIISSKDTEGIHHIECPFCKYEKGSDFEPYIKVTFDKLPPFCEKCGADMRGEKE